MSGETPVPVTSSGGGGGGVVTQGAQDATHAPWDMSAAPIALDAATLAALENITATIANAIDLSAATLAALETIQVGSVPVDPFGATADAAVAAGATGSQSAKLRAISRDLVANVGIATVPADPFGANADAAVAAGATGSFSAKLRALSRDLIANIVLAAGGNIIGKVGVDQTTPGTTNGVTPVAAAVGGASLYKTLDLDETEEQIKATAGTLYGWYAVNRSAAPIYLKFYNDTAANVVVGTTVPVLTFEIPGLAANHVGAVWAFDIGLLFSVAMTFAATTGFADADTGAPAANDLIAMAFYK